MVTILPSTFIYFDESEYLGAFGLYKGNDYGYNNGNEFLNPSFLVGLEIMGAFGLLAGITMGL